MAIKVLAFGQISDILSRSEMEFSAMKDTEELRREIAKQFPGLSALNYVISVNKKIVLQNTSLKDNDVVALLPPFSGG
jgi:molybdopterin synthase sulfur carrier subunit